MTGAVAILIMYKIAAMMLVIGCPLAMVSGYNPPSERRTKGKTKRRNGSTKQRPVKEKVKVKSRKPKAWHGAPKLSDTQLMQDRMYIHGRDFGSTPQPNRMPL